MNGGLAQGSDYEEEETGGASSGRTQPLDGEFRKKTEADIQHINQVLYVGYIVLLVTVAGMTIAVCAFVFSAIRDTYTPPKGCVAWFDGCNTCSLGSNGQAACTLMACGDKPAPGRCISYQNDKPTVTKPTPSTPAASSTSSPATTGTATATSTPGEPARNTGFVFRIWNFILSLLPWR